MGNFLAHEPRRHRASRPAVTRRVGPRAAVGALARPGRRAARAAGLAGRALRAAPGLARPPRMVGTFSLWRTPAEMKDYAYRQGGGHSRAMIDHARIGFHQEALFARFRPYRSAGAWEGRDPLASVAAAGAVEEPGA